MGRKDERGVTAAAPIKYNNPATVRLPRIDDEHRGPAVADAYELSTCRIALMEVSRDWPLPDELPDALLGLAQGVPEDQRQEWLRAEAAREEVTRLISSAMRSGELPIWIAPKDGPDRPVAPSAMLEVDHATLVSGVYRPPNDRGWLYGRPLFVKHSDWHRFVSKVRSIKGGQKAAFADKPMAAGGAAIGAGQVPMAPKIGLPDAIRELYQSVQKAVSQADPAPWFDVPSSLVEMFSEGDDDAFIRRKKMEERSKLIMQRGLLTGDLRAHFADGVETRDVPGWAWEGAERNEPVWFDGRLPLDVLLPDHWLRWSCHSVFLDRKAFMDWMHGQELTADGLSELPASFDAGSKPERVKKRLPSDCPFVSLSEALTWVAFGIALENDSLDRALSGQAFGPLDPQIALSDAMAKLALRASGGQIAMRGKYVESHSVDETRVLTESIEPVRLEDFAQYDVLYDGLRYGVGLTWVDGGGTIERALHGRGDAFRSVKVSREDLLNLFPDQDDTARAGPFKGDARNPVGRAPSVKTGRPPSDAAILAKADEMKARGMDGRTIAKIMRLEPGFENVANTTVRDLIKGRWKPAGRPKNKGA